MHTSSHSFTDSPVHTFPDGKSIYLLDREEAEKAIIDDDNQPYFNQMTSLEISIRMNRELDLSKTHENREIFKKFLQKNVRSWTETEKKGMIEILKEAYYYMNKINSNLIPQKWYFIKTTGKEEGGAFYTRGKYIAVPQKALNRYIYNDEERDFLFKMVHETFHVYSRYHPEMRHKLYRLIGFQKKEPVSLGTYLARIKFTNPDATDHSYRITIKNADDQPIQVIGLIYSRYPKFIKNYGTLFAYLKFSLFEVRLKNGIWHVQTNDQEMPKPISPYRAKGFFEQIGRNTNYIIHPEEIMADNVTYLVLRKKYNQSIYGGSYGKQLLDKIYQTLNTS